MVTHYLVDFDIHALAFYMMPCKAGLTLDAILIIPYCLAAAATRIFGNLRSRMGLHIIGESDQEKAYIQNTCTAKKDP